MFNFKKITSLLLILMLTLSFTACSVSDNSTANETESTVSNDSKWNYGTDESETEEKTLTLDNAKVRLIYFNDIWAEYDNVYFLVAYYGPQKVSFSFVNSDGTEIEDFDGPMYYDFNNGWILLESSELPNGTSLENLAVKIVDYSTDERNSRLFTDFGEPATKEELLDIGVTYMGDDFCTVTHENRLSAFDDLAMFSVSFKWYCQNGYSSMGGEESLPYTVEDFEFFAGDGTPLSEFADGYDYYLTASFSSRNYDITGITVNFEVNDGDTTDGRTNDFCQMLEELDVYMIYTDGEGVQHRFDNILTRPAK